MSVKKTLGKIGGVMGDLLKTVAPTLAVAAAGPLGPTVGLVLKEALGRPDATDDDLETMALAGFTPDQVIAIKEAERSFEARLAEHNIQLQELDNADRANARAREIALQDRTPTILAYIVVIGFFAMLGLLLWMVFSGQPTPDGSESLFIMVGALTAGFGTVLTYYYGSSAGSRRKDERASASTRKP